MTSDRARHPSDSINLPATEVPDLARNPGVVNFRNVGAPGTGLRFPYTDARNGEDDPPRGADPIQDFDVNADRASAAGFFARVSIGMPPLMDGARRPAMLAGDPEAHATRCERPAWTKRLRQRVPRNPLRRRPPAPAGFVPMPSGPA